MEITYTLVCVCVKPQCLLFMLSTISKESINKMTLTVAEYGIHHS